MYCGWCCWHNCSIECTAVLFCAVNCPLRLYEVWSRHIITDYSLLHLHQYTVSSSLSICSSSYWWVEELLKIISLSNSYEVPFSYLIFYLVFFGLKLLTPWNLFVLSLLLKKDIYSVWYTQCRNMPYFWNNLLIYIVVFIYKNCYQHTRNLLKSGKLVKNNFFSVFRHQAWYWPTHIFFLFSCMVYL